MSSVHEELSKEIIGTAMQMLNTLKPGLDERIYENALVLELKAAGHLIEQQRQFPVIYRGINVGTLIPDLIVDGSVIVDPKVGLSLYRDSQRTNGGLSCHYGSLACDTNKLQEC
jgi:GxxExxY protein